MLAPLIATTINPLLVALILLAPFLSSRPYRPWPFWARCFFGIGLAVLLAESGKRFEVWHGHPSFPSGHETFCLAAITCLAFADRRWLFVGLPLSALMAWALVAAHYHTPIDIAGALVTGPVPAILCHWVRTKKALP